MTPSSQVPSEESSFPSGNEKIGSQKPNAQDDYTACGDFS